MELIPNSDSLEVATVLGWHVVVKKDEFKEGEIVVYFEVDSLLPQIPEFKFLERYGVKSCNIDNKIYMGYLLKTRKIRGYISQGLIMPLSLLENKTEDFNIGTDVSSLLNVIKYEISDRTLISGEIEDIFPTYLIPKTDEIRLQTEPDLIQRYAYASFCVTEKIDGCSATYYIDKMHLKLKACSRNYIIKENINNVYWKVAKLFSLEEKLKKIKQEYGLNVAIQGEIAGVGINKNPLKLTNLQFYAFNLYDMDKCKYLDYINFLKISESPFINLQIVPVVYYDKYPLKTIDEMIALADFNSFINEGELAEGLVWHSLINNYKENPNGKLSFKIINPNYLLKTNT